MFTSVNSIAEVSHQRDEFEGVKLSLQHELNAATLELRNQRLAALAREEQTLAAHREATNSALDTKHALQQSLMELREQNDELQAQLIASQAREEHATVTLTATKDQLNAREVEVTRIESVKTSLEDEIAKLRHAALDMNATLQEYKDRHMSSQSSLQAKDAELLELQLRLTTTETQLAASFNDVSQHKGEIDRLTALLNDSQESAASVTSELFEKQEKSLRLEAILTEANARYTQSQVKLQELEGLNSTLASENAEHALVIATLQDSHIAANDELQLKVVEYSHLQDSYQRLASDHEALAAAQSSLQAAHTDLQSEHDSLQTEYAGLAAKHAASLGDFVSLQAEYTALKSEHSALQIETSRLVGAVEDYETSSASQRETILHLEASIAESALQLAKHLEEVTNIQVQALY
jgi:chromosome segregation ATPase